MDHYEEEKDTFKGSVKWKKRGGGYEWYQSIKAFNFSTFPQIFYCFLKDPGPLNHKKRISAVCGPAVYFVLTHGDSSNVNGLFVAV